MRDKIDHHCTRMADEKTQKKLSAIVKGLPSGPGVYKFVGDGRVLYVGKAKNLKSRVQTYFRKDDKRVMRLKKMVEGADDLEYIEVDSELEAFILETNMIKELKPKYNVLMKDDKNYVYIKITQGEDYPRIEVVRKMEKDGARYFGPKTSATSAREMIDLLHKLFRFRNCKLGIKALDAKDTDGNLKVEITNKVINFPCLEYHIKRCDAPCIGKITPEEYQKNIDEIIAFLEGKHGKVIEFLKVRMGEAVAAKNFEYAAKLRDKLLAVERVQERQKISEATHENRDVISFVIQGDKAFFNLFVVRDGKLINQENFVIDTKLKGLVDPEDVDLRSELLERFMKDYYEHTADFPKEILVSEEEIDVEFMEMWLEMHAEVKVKIRVPKKGKKSKLLELSLKNAQSFAKQCQIKWDSDEARTVGACAELAEALGIPEIKRIECFDISHLSGHETVASMAVFENGKPKKSDYRHFMIKTLSKGDIDDFKSMEEVLARRLKYLVGKQESELDKVKAGWKGWKLRKVKKDELKVVNKLKKAGGWNPAESVKGYFLLENEGEVRGLVCLDQKGDVFHLKNVFLEEDVRGQGLGKFMISKVLSSMKEDQLYIVTGKRLQEYYEDFGFSVVKKVPDELSDSVKACEKKFSEGVAVMLFDKVESFSKYADFRVSSTEEEGDMLYEAKVFGAVVGSVIMKKEGRHFALSEMCTEDAYRDAGLYERLLEKALKDCDEPKLYISTKDPDRFLKLGFEEMKNPPKEIEVGKGEVLLGYYRSKQSKSDPSFGAMPDLIVIDGGKGQLSSAMKAVEVSGVCVNICSLAKKQEDVYLPGQSSPVHLRKDSQAQYLVQRIRDEAHRFAITHNRKRRDKEMLKS